MAKVICIIFLDFIYLFLQRGKGREKEIRGKTSFTCRIWNLFYNPGMYPDLEWIQEDGFAGWIPTKQDMPARAKTDLKNNF